MLVARVRAGDPEAERLLLRRHHSAIERVCRRLCDHEADLEDVIQETYLAIVRSFPSFRGEANFLTWVYTIARTHRGRARRRNAIEQRRRTALAEFAALDLDSGLGPEAALSDRELRAALERALAPLDGVDRQILVLRDLEGRTAAEVASQVRLTVPAVKTRLHRARVFARAQLAEHRPVQRRQAS